MPEGQSCQIGSPLLLTLTLAFFLTLIFNVYFNDQRTITQKFHFQTTENAKNSRSSRVLTQGDKLNLIKARKFQQASKNNLVEGSGENQESKIQGLDSSTPAKTKSKTSTDGKTSKLNSLRTAKPNILPKREGSRTNSRLVLLEEVAAQI